MKSLAATLAFAGAVLAPLSAAYAQESFRQSCREVSYTGDVIRATCNAPGLLLGQRTSLRVPTSGCMDIENRNGRLRCIRASAPIGSWRETCSNGHYTDGNRNFRARCRARNGAWVTSDIDAARCPRRYLENRDGRLRCGPTF